MTPDEVLRNGWRDVVHPEHLPGVAERWMHSLSTGDPYKTEFRLRGADGSYRWHLNNASFAGVRTIAATRS